MVDLPLRSWIAATLVFLAVTLGTISLTLFWEWLRERRRRRGVDEQLRRLGQEGIATAATAKLLREPRPEGLAGSLRERFRHLREVEILLQQAKLDWSVQSYLGLAVGFAAACGLFALLLGLHPLLVLIAVAAGASAPHLYIRRRRTQRLRAFEQQLPEAIDLLGRAIRAGHPITSGLKMVADEAPEPVSGEFRRVFEEQRFGLAFDDSLLGMADRIPLVDVRIFVTAVLIQREVGGNLAEILDKLSYVIRQRFSILRQLRVYTAQGRMSGYILAGLPIFLAIVLFVLNPGNMINFVNAPLGRLLITVAVVLQLMGFLWIRRIIRIEV